MRERGVDRVAAGVFQLRWSSLPVAMAHSHGLRRRRKGQEGFPSLSIGLANLANHSLLFFFFLLNRVNLPKSPSLIKGKSPLYPFLKTESLHSPLLKKISSSKFGMLYQHKSKFPIGRLPSLRSPHSYQDQLFVMSNSLYSALEYIENHPISIISLLFTQKVFIILK